MLPRGRPRGRGAARGAEGHFGLIVLRHMASLFCHQPGSQSSYGALVRSIKSLASRSIDSTWSRCVNRFIFRCLMKLSKVWGLGFWTEHIIEPTSPRGQIRFIVLIVWVPRPYKLFCCTRSLQTNSRCQILKGNPHGFWEGRDRTTRREGEGCPCWACASGGWRETL